MRATAADAHQRALEHQCSFGEGAAVALLAVGREAAPEGAAGAPKDPGAQSAALGAQRAMQHLRAAARASGARVSVLRADGSTVFDSAEAQPELIERQSAQLEFTGALASGLGVDRRYGPTRGERLLFVARALRDPAPDGPLIGVLRLAEAERATAAARSSDRAALLGIGLVTLALALAGGAALLHPLAAPLAELARAARALLRGDPNPRMPQPNSAELGAVADSLLQLGEELQRRVERTSKEGAQLRAMLAGMGEGVVAVDEHDRVVFSNRAAARLLALEAELPLGQRLWELVRLPDLVRLLEEARADRAALGREITVLSDGRELVLEAHANTFKAEGASGVVVVLQDVTNLRRLERIRRDFVANVSHELKTPLTAIKGYVETLIDGAMEDPPHGRRFLAKIDDHVQRLTHLVKDLLSLARIESQAQGVQLAPLDLRALLVEVVGRHEAAMREKGLSWSTGGESGPMVCLGDVESLGQVVDNLLDNAIHYTPGPGSIQMTLTRSEQHVRLDVRDSGIGIPEQDLERIFERFYRVDKARSRELGGTGLGLSIVKHLMQTMNGEVRVTSELGRGSCFSILLQRA
jgi:two-component system phosphate regulon sensor histidine kinase PhoR